MVILIPKQIVQPSSNPIENVTQVHKCNFLSVLVHLGRSVQMFEEPGTQSYIEPGLITTTYIHQEFNMEWHHSTSLSSGQLYLGCNTPKYS